MVKKGKFTLGGRKFLSYLGKENLNNKKPERSLRRILPKHSGRDAKGQVSIRHQGGRQKRFLREIDFRREKKNISAKVVSLEYDPNRGAAIALLNYIDGEKRYILAPESLKVGDELISGEKAPVKIGNNLPLEKIPIGTIIHNVELTPGKGGQIVRGAGTGATVQAKEGSFATLRLPSKEERKISLECCATIGQVCNAELKNIKLGKAGRKRHMGWRPTVRGVAQNPNSHPHGGGEGRSGIGMPSPKSPWGKKTLGKKTRRRKKYSNKLIIKRRR